MMEFLDIMLPTAVGTAVGAVLVKVMLADVLEKPSRMSKKADDRLNGARVRLWREGYIIRCIEAGRDPDIVTLIKFDALVVSYRRREITYREFSDELDRLDNPDPPSE